MPLRVFASRNVTGANLVQVLSVAGMFGTFFLGSLYLQRILGYDPLQIGLAFLPVTVVMGTLSVRYTERLVTRFGARKAVVTGQLVSGGGPGVVRAGSGRRQLPDARLPRHGPGRAGAGLCFPALMMLAMSGATPATPASPPGLINTTAQVGGALGLAVLATISASRTHALLAAGGPGRVVGRRLPPRLLDRRRPGGRRRRRGVSPSCDPLATPMRMRREGSLALCIPAAHSRRGSSPVARCWRQASRYHSWRPASRKGRGQLPGQG